MMLEMKPLAPWLPLLSFPRVPAAVVGMAFVSIAAAWRGERDARE